jgi:RNA recognition motif-containing protein
MGAQSEEDRLAEEAAELDGYFSDTPLDPQPNYPPLKDTFECAVVLTNLPQVPEAKLEKLTKVVMKLVSRIGTLAANADTGFTGLHMPYNNDKGSTMGFCFVEYETPKEAKNAVQVLQDYKFDKNHALSVMLYQRFLKLQKHRAKKKPVWHGVNIIVIGRPRAPTWLPWSPVRE